MPFPLVPAVLVALAGGAYYKVKVQGKLSPERQRIYDAALTSLRDPVKLRSLADTFDAQGHKKEATLLRKRAGLKELPNEVRAARREAFSKGMNSTNAEAIEALAKSFDDEGATGAAANLRNRAKFLKTT
jgi:hypothetical protein